MANSVRSCRVCTFFTRTSNHEQLHSLYRVFVHGTLIVSQFNGEIGKLWSTKDVCQEICRILVIVPSSDLLEFIELC